MNTNSRLFQRFYSVRTLILIFVLICCTHIAYAYDFEVDGLCYNKLQNNEVEVTYRSFLDKSYSGELRIPEKVSYNGITYSVTSIGKSAFYYCSGLTGSLTIPNSVASIGSGAFEGCSGLTGSLTIPNSVTSIGASAFRDCTGLTGTLTIPNSVTLIENFAFCGCGEIAFIKVKSGNTIYDSRNDCNAIIKTKTNTLIVGCKNTTIPNSVTCIGNSAFCGCSVTGALTIPNSVTSIETCAFYNCSGLTGTLTIPSSVTSIGSAAFYGCSGLTSIMIPYSVTSIDNKAFSSCNSLTSIKVENGNSKYDSRNGCNAIIETKTNTLITGCKNTIIPSTVTSIKSYAFYNCSGLTGSLNIPNSVTSIGQYAFYNCSGLTGSLNIPNSLTSIGQDAFYGCNRLTSLTIPNSVTSIGSAAFHSGSELVSVKSEIETPSIIENNVFHRSSSKIIESTLYVPKGTKSKYQELTGWVKYFNKVVEYEIDPSTYTLSITVSGNGSATYNSTAIRSKTQTFTVNEGTSATVKFTPDAGHRIASVKLNNTDVTASVANNSYTISNIMANTTLAVTFEEIPSTTYVLTISAVGSGSVTYDGNTVRGKTSSFTVVEGTNAVVTFSADDGNRLKSVKLGNTDITSSVVNNQYTISNIQANTSLEVTFEAIPTYSLNITASGNGCATYNGTAVRGKTQSFTVNDGTSATVTFTPDAGYRIAIVKLNNTDVTASIANNSYTISNITANTTLTVTFEEIPPTTYVLTISAVGNGTVTYEGNTVKGKTSSFTVVEGTNAVVTFSADDGNRLKSVKLGNTDVTSSVVNNQYTISNIKANTSLEVTFEAIPTYSLNVTASGNGNATYNGIAVRGKTQSFTVNEGTSATVKFTPDAGYRIASVKVNGTDVTSSVANSQYTISNIKSGNTLAVEFEAIPPSTYMLNIVAVGNGSVSYNNTTIRNQSKDFTVVEKSAVTITISPDNGYRLASVIVNDVDVTANVSNNHYTISNISEATNIEVKFEAITHIMDIIAKGNGTAIYSGTTIRDNNDSFTITEGSSASIRFTPDVGHKIKSVLLNDVNVTSDVINNVYTISNITRNNILEVEFEAIMHTLTIKATGNGSVSYNDISFSNQSKSFKLKEGVSTVISITPDSGYRIKSVTVNSTDMTSQVTNGQITISNIAQDTNVEVTFEEIPPTTYSLTITAAGNGAVTYDGQSVRGGSSTFTVVEGSYATVQIGADDGYRLKRVMLDGKDVTADVTNGQYTTTKIMADMTLAVEFEEAFTELAYNGVNYKAVSYEEQKVNVVSGNYGLTLTVPATFEADGKTWTVAGIDNGALANATELAAIIWEPEVAFTAEVSNPNLLLYVKNAAYAPATIQNVVVGNIAEEIVLTEAAEGNNFYCPRAFTAKYISYEHNYSMITGYKTCQGWETIVLPFDVSMMISSKGKELVPYVAWQDGSSQRPFWLYQLTSEGWLAANGIRANVPYIISMPNNEVYHSSYNIAGNVQFIGNNVEVKASDNVGANQYGNWRLMGNYQNKDANSSIYVLNVNNLWSQNTDTELEGSAFIRNLRAVHPFEAYMAWEGSGASQRVIPIFDDNLTTAIYNVSWMKADSRNDDNWYTLDGRKLQGEPRQNGIYIYKGKKVKK